MRGKPYTQTVTSLTILGLFIAHLILPQKTLAKSNWTRTNLGDKRIKAITNSPWGILAGEYDQLIWKNPYNGIYITNDFGETWNEIGLTRRGITDIKHFDEKIYATTYYYDEGVVGLFKSEDIGNNWQHISQNFSTSTVSVNQNSILLGTYSHGLWISRNDGETWIQKIGDGFFGPKIYETKVSKDVMLATGETKTYISKDQGNSWNTIEELDGLRIRSIEITDKVILAGTDNEQGLYKSKDNGETWHKIDLWENQPVGGITFYRSTFYAGRKDIELNKFDVYQSKDLGETWTPLALPQIYNAGISPSLTWAFSIPSYILPQYL